MLSCRRRQWIKSFDATAHEPISNPLQFCVLCFIFGSRTIVWIETSYIFAHWSNVVSFEETTSFSWSPRHFFRYIFVCFVFLFLSNHHYEHWRVVYEILEKPHCGNVQQQCRQLLVQRVPHLPVKIIRLKYKPKTEPQTNWSNSIERKYETAIPSNQTI